MRYMSKQVRVLIKILLCFVIITENSCNNNNESLNSMLLKMKSVPVKLDIDQYKNICLSDSIVPFSSQDYKFIKYIDSTNCTSCVLQNLYLWNDFIDLYKEQYKNVSFYFIISDKNLKEMDILFMLKNTNFNHSILLDTSNVFMRTNPNIPSESKWHTFVLDKSDSIILVGDPIHNKKIEELYNQTMDEFQLIFILLSF